MTNGVRSKLTPFYLKFIAARTITKCEYQAIKLADHTQLYRVQGTLLQNNNRNNRRPRFLEVVSLVLSRKPCSPVYAPVFQTKPLPASPCQGRRHALPLIRGRWRGLGVQDLCVSRLLSHKWGTAELCS